MLPPRRFARDIEKKPRAIELHIPLGFTADPSTVQWGTEWATRNQREAAPVPYPLWLTKVLLRTGIAHLLPGFRGLTDLSVGSARYFSDRLLASPLELVRDTAPFLEAHSQDLIDLSLAAPQFDIFANGIPGKIVAGQRTGPWIPGALELRAAIAESLCTTYHLEYAPEDEVLVTAGATAALNLALDTFLSPRDRVVLLDPSSRLFPLAVMHRRGQLRWVPSEVERGTVRFALAKLVPQLRRAKMLVLQAPVNPTGASLDPEDLEQIAWYCDREDVLIFSDQSFEQYQSGGPNSSITVYPKAARRTLLANSLSQSHGLAAYRIGWLAGPRRLLRPCAMTAFLQGATVPTLCQQLAMAAMHIPRESLDPIRRELLERRGFVYEQLQTMGLRPTVAAGGYFIWLPVTGLNVTGRIFAEEMLRDYHVLLLPGELFGPSGRDSVRLSLAAGDAQLREGIKRIGDYVRGLAPLASHADLRLAM